FGGDEDAVIYVCGAPRLECIDLIGNLILIFREGQAQFGFGGEGKQRRLVVGLEGREGDRRGVTQRGQEWTNRIAQIQYYRNIYGQFVATENFYFLGNTIFANLEVVFFQIGHDLVVLRLHGRVNQDKVHVHANGTLALVLRVDRDSEDKRNENDRSCKTKRASPESRHSRWSILRGASCDHLKKSGIAGHRNLQCHHNVQAKSSRL